MSEVGLKQIYPGQSSNNFDVPVVSDGKLLPSSLIREAIAIPTGSFLQRPPTPSNGLLRYNSDINTFERYEKGIWKNFDNYTFITVTQLAHGFVDGEIVRFDGTQYVKSQANNNSNSEVAGMVFNSDINTFELILNGYIDLTDSPVSYLPLTPGETYFLSTSTAGILQTTVPSAVGHVNKPLLTALTTTTGLFVNFRGVELINSSSSSYRQSFTNSDLISGILTVNHTLAEQYVLVQVYDNNNRLINPDNIQCNLNQTIIDLTSFGSIPGTWNIIVKM